MLVIWDAIAPILTGYTGPCCKESNSINIMTIHFTNKSNSHYKDQDSSEIVFIFMAGIPIQVKTAPYTQNLKHTLSSPEFNMIFILKYLINFQTYRNCPNDSVNWLHHMAHLVDLTVDRTLPVYWNSGNDGSSVMTYG